MHHSSVFCIYVCSARSNLQLLNSSTWQTRKVKVKYTLVQALRLCTGRTAHRGSRGIAPPFHDHGTGRGWGVSVTPRPLFTPGKDSVLIVQEAGPVCTGADNLVPTGIRSPDRPAPSQSLYWLRYPAHPQRWGNMKKWINTLFHFSSIPFVQIMCSNCSRALKAVEAECTTV